MFKQSHLFSEIKGTKGVIILSVLSLSMWSFVLIQASQYNNDNSEQRDIAF